MNRAPLKANVPELRLRSVYIFIFFIILPGSTFTLFLKAKFFFFYFRINLSIQTLRPVDTIFKPEVSGRLQNSVCNLIFIFTNSYQLVILVSLGIVTKFDSS